MIKIDKNLRDWLVNEKHVPCGENGVSRTYSKAKTYYLCESKYNMQLLKEYNDLIRNSK